MSTGSSVIHSYIKCITYLYFGYRRIRWRKLPHESWNTVDSSGNSAEKLTYIHTYIFIYLFIHSFVD